jgi:uncharacterized membrane protein YidH (DUF202 family)
LIDSADSIISASTTIRDKGHDMVDPIENKKTGKVGNPQVHMANERTFLAWIRTSIGIMAFGFVVERFAFFIKKLSFFLTSHNIPELQFPILNNSSMGYSSIFGIFLVAVGAFLGVLAFMRFMKTEKEIDDDAYRPSLVLDILVTMGMFAMGVFIVMYMIHNL